MDTLGEASMMTSIVGGNGVYLFIAAFAILAFLGIGYVLYKRANTMPVIQGFENQLPPPIQTNMKGQEGFYGGVARGAGTPDCIRASSDAAALYALFAGKVSGVEEGGADFSEFTLLLSTLSCFKKDLIGIAGVIEATKYQEFNTQLDLEPIAETTARCFAKTIPARDLDLAFDKWGKRGHFLITRLCTASGASESEFSQAENLFGAFLRDVKDIAVSRCLSGVPKIGTETAPREEVPYTPPSVTDLGVYKGYY